MAIPIKSNLIKTFGDEAKKIRDLTELGSNRTNTNNVSYTSATSSATYDTSASSDPNVLNKGEDGLLYLLFTTFKENIIDADFLNEVIASIYKSSLIYAEDVGNTDAYAISLEIAPISYTSGMMINFKANTTNTGSCTLNINGLGAITIKDISGNDLLTDTITSGQIVSVIYNGTNFVTTSPIKTGSITQDEHGLHLVNDEAAPSEESFYGYRNGQRGFFKRRQSPFTNGWFDVWQAGANFAGDGYTADMWRLIQAGAAITVTRSAFPAGQTTVPGNPKYFLHMMVTRGDNYARIANIIEDVQQLSGETITVPFWAKGYNPGSGRLGVCFLQNFGSGGSVELASNIESIVLSSSWQKYEITFYIPSVEGKTIGADSYTEFRIFQLGEDTSTNAWQLDLAAVGDRKTFAEELASCQRYYWQGEFPDSYGYQYATAGANLMIAGGVSFPVTMRTNPALVMVTAPNYANCSDSDLIGNENGLIHRVQVTENGVFRASGSIYAADARIY